jgi:solute:Na+ symporter, SSS family
MTPYDYAVLAFYFVYLLVISWVFRRFVHNISDYFRSGGQVIWWMAGGSAFIVSFSAWTFTGAASRAYGDGWPIMMIYVGNVAGFVGSALYFAPRFRQLRVITSMQAIRARFGAANEQFFMWLTLPLRLMYAGIWLYGLGVFFSAAFSMDLTLTILLAGGTVTAIALVGGSWAVVASDFIQVLILMPVTMVATVLAVAKLGGAGAFVHQLSATRLNFGKLFTDDFLLFWCVAMLAKQFLSANSLTEAPRYFCVKDSRHAKKAALLAAALMLMGIVIWFVPPMAASVTNPDLARLYPGLRQPGEGSFFAIAAATFPVGMLGLLVSGVFAATMSAMDAGLNSNAGIFIKNFYQPALRPTATERELLLAGKLTTLAFGVSVILLAQFFSHFAQFSLFQLMLDFGVLVALPQTLPLVLGIFIRRTPAWSGWSTVLIGFATGWLARHFLTVDWALRTLGGHPNPNSWERQNWDQAIAVCANIAVGTAWFCWSRRFYRRESDAYKSAIDAFARQIERPVDHPGDTALGATEDRQSWLIGWLCLPYGAVICLLALIPNPPSGRLAFIFCGGVLLLIGGALIRQSRAQAGPHRHA